MSCSDKNYRGEEGDYERPVVSCKSVEGPSRNGSITTTTTTTTTTSPHFSIDERVIVDPKQLFIGSKIGEGAHGKVYQGRYGDRIVAIKVLNHGNNSDERTALEGRFAREVTMMSRVKHENLVKFIGACKDPLMVIVTELLPGMSLRKYLVSIRPKQLDLHVALNYALDIARAMDCLHANGIIHRDLKPDNLLLTANQQSVKLADFGLAREESVTEMMTAETGTYRWMAPELYSTVTLRQGEKKHYNNKVDVYSFGIVLWELLTNRMPFEGMSNLQAAYAAAFKQERPSISEDVSPDLAFIMQSCWVEDPNLRPSFSQIIRLLNEFLFALPPPAPSLQDSQSKEATVTTNGSITEFSARARGKFAFLRQLFAAKKKRKHNYVAFDLGNLLKIYYEQEQVLFWAIVKMKANGFKSVLCGKVGMEAMAYEPANPLKQHSYQHQSKGIIEVNNDLTISKVTMHHLPDIKTYSEAGGRDGSGVCTYNEMVEYFNKKANLSGHTPLGSFNAAFSYTGSTHIDAATTKTLCMDGFFIPLVKVELVKSPLVLQENARRAVPTSWDPPALASFIENFGTHVITSVTIGGKDVIYVKQHDCSSLSTMEIKSYVQDIGNQRFSSAESLTSSGLFKYKDKGSDPSLFNSQGIYPQPSTAPFLAGNGKEDVTVIFRRRGGDDLEQSHTQWARTVRSSPDVIEMQFYPIALLLEGVRGKEHLTRAIDLYLEYKPQIEELRYFLEFQVPRIWAPIQDRLPGQSRKEPVCPSLQFSMMGQKLYVSPEQVSVGRKPVTGMRLRLEGSKQNRLCIHLQHLASLPKILQPYWDTHVAIGAPKWQGPEEQDSRWFEPVKWKNFSHVSTAPIESPETFIGDFSGVYVVTGAQLGVWDFGSRNVLHMKLLYSRLPGCTIRRSLWDHAPNEKLRKQVTAGPNSSDSTSGSGEKVVGNKLAKFVDTKEMCKGPQDPPGHWLVTGGKLGVEKGKVVLRLKYSLLNY